MTAISSPGRSSADVPSSTTGSADVHATVHREQRVGRGAAKGWARVPAEGRGGPPSCSVAASAADPGARRTFEEANVGGGVDVRDTCVQHSVVSGQFQEGGRVRVGGSRGPAAAPCIAQRGPPLVGKRDANVAGQVAVGVGDDVRVCDDVGFLLRRFNDESTGGAQRTRTARRVGSATAGCEREARPRASDGCLCPTCRKPSCS